MTTGYQAIPSHLTHPSLDAFHHSHSHPHPLPHANHTQGQTCVPSLIPRGVDPSQMDLRNFYTYQPNEVKHRKRTTRPQLKVLEDVYGHDTKPNAILRKKLADELGMTPRGVQVWFQNRRAKEKNLAKKTSTILSATGTTSSASSSSTPALAPSLPKADSTTMSNAEASTESVVSDTCPENTLGALDFSSIEEPLTSSNGAAQRPSLSTLPTCPPIPALEDVAHIDGLSGAASTSDDSSFSGFKDSHAGSLPIRMNPATADLLGQRRSSLPILNLPSSPNAIRRMPSGLSGKATKSYDIYERRKSVDTMSVNMRRLAAHPYAQQAAQYATGHGQGSFGYSAQMPVGPHGLQARRSISHTGLTAMDDSDSLGVGPLAASGRAQQQMAPGRTYFITPTLTQPHDQNRPMLTQRMSMPCFHEQQEQQQQPSPPTAAANGSFAGMAFNNPWDSQPQSTSSASETPISPHALPPPSPAASAPPLPISHSYSGSMLGQSLSRRFARHHDRSDHSPSAYHNARPIPAPVPGPLPDAHFSFGLPSSTPSSTASSSSSSNVNDSGLSSMMGRVAGMVEEEADDASVVSSTYDPHSRFGSFASTESSWTSYYSDADGRKLSLSAPDGFDARRRESIASGYLPQLFGELDVNSGCNPQNVCDGSVPTDQPQHDHSRRGSSASVHEQQAFQDTYGTRDVYDQHLHPDGFVPTDQSPYSHTPPQNEGYAAEHGSYSPSSTISAHSQGVQNGKGIGEHSLSNTPPMAHHSHSHSQELRFALHHSNGTESLNSSEGQLVYPAEFDQSLSSPSQHHLSPHQANHQYSQMPSKPQYPSHSYAQHSDAYDMAPPHMQIAYPSPPMDYTYQMFQGTPVYDSGAVDLGSMCVPAVMDGVHMGDYLQS